MFHCIVPMAGAFVTASAVTSVASLLRRETNLKVWWDNDGFLIGSLSFVALFVVASLFNF